MDTKNGTGGIARNISATLQSLQTENEQLRAGYDAARQEIASLTAQPYDQQAMGLCHVCGWKGVIDYPDGPVCVACEHDKTLSPQPTAQPLHVAATSCPHEIDKDKIVLHFDSKQPGKNALAQLAARLQAAQAQPVHWVTPTIAQMKEYCKQASAMMARDLTRFDAACEVMGYLKEMRAPGYYMHRMNIVLHGNVEGTDAARASDKAPQPAAHAQHEGGKSEALADLAYAHGMTTGWNLCIADKHDEFARIRSMRSSQAISTIEAPQPAAQAQEDAGGWLRNGALLYRLTDERRPANFDEIRVTMANGSRDIGQMSAQAERLLVMLTAPQPAPGAPCDPSITLDFKMTTELLKMFGEEPGLVTLQQGSERSHSGAGLYAWYSDMPDEGAEFLGAEPDDEAVPEATPAQAVPAPGVEAVSEREFKQFRSDVITAAGLVTHGKKCKDLGRRLGEMSMRLLTAPMTAAAPAQAQDALKQVCAIAVSAAKTNSRDIADWREDMDRIAAIAAQKGNHD